jgi:hypothetical protein
MRSTLNASFLSRSARPANIDDLAAVESCLNRMIERNLMLTAQFWAFANDVLGGFQFDSSQEPKEVRVDYEGVDQPIPYGPSMLLANRHMRDILQLKGYQVHYAEFSGGHHALSWRGTFGDALIALIGQRPPRPGERARIAATAKR